MSEPQLSTRELELLKWVVATERPCLVYLVDRAVAGSLTPAQRSALQEIVVDAFCAELDDDDEPTPKGVALDDLIGALARGVGPADDDVDMSLVEEILDCQERRPTD